MSELARQLGSRRAQLFQGFACFAYEQARAMDLDRLYFMTREGVFFKAVFDALFSHGSQVGPAIQSELIDASRQATFGPSVLQPGSADFSRLWGLYPRMSPLAFLKSLNLGVEEFGGYFENQGLALHEIVDSPGENPGFLEVLNNPEFRDRLGSSLEHDRALAVRYFAGKFENRSRVGIVEIGWQGSIQDNLAFMFPDIEFHGFYMGLAISKIRPPGNSRKIAFGPDRNRSKQDCDLLDAVNVLEFICLSTGGSVGKFQLDASGEVVARRSPDPAEEKLIEAFSVPFQQGVVERCSPGVGAELLAQHRAGELQSSALEQWRRLLGDPDPALVETYFTLKSNEEFGMGEFRDQSLTPSWKMILLAPFSATYRSGLIRYLTYSQWAEGMRARRDIAVPKRMVLSWMIKFAVAVKSWIHTRRWRRGS